MVTITQHPSETSFAGNPIILKARSGLSEKTFLKICAEVKTSIYQRASLLSSFTRTLSIPTNGGGETVVFDLSDLMQSALSQISMERNSTLSEGTPSFTSGYVRYTVEVWDEYLDNYSEVISTKGTASQSTGVRNAIPGAYTDMQRLKNPEDTDSYLGSAKILSNKPEHEAVPAGGKVVVPVYSNSYKSAGVYLDSVQSSNRLTTQSLYASEVSWEGITIPESTRGLSALIWEGLNVPPFFIYAVPKQPFATYFEFVNRMGAVESVYAYGRRQHKHNVQQERQIKKHNTSFRPAARYVKRTLQEEESIVMSTGPVTRKWAQWFAREFFTAEKAWMYNEDAADMIPVIIECEEDITTINESEAEVLDLQFTVVKCING